MNTKEAIRFVVVRSLGNFLLLLSLYGVVVIFGKAVYYELQYRLKEARSVRFTVQSSQFRVQNNKEIDKTVATGGAQQERGREGVGFWDVLAGAKEQVLIPIDTDFSIVIPKIAARAKIYSNIDPEDSEGFKPVLQRGIAHAKGSVFPGMGGNIYLFAHSSSDWWDAGRVNPVFYLLKDLDAGDEVVVFFERRRYEYVVKEKFITDPTYTDFLSDTQTGSEKLILQTCWPPGTAWRRLFVVAKPKSSI